MIQSLAARSETETAPFTIEIDPVAKMIRATCRGFWDARTALAYVEELTRYIAVCRRNFGSVRVFGDTRDSAVQSPEVFAVLQRITDHLQPGDRVALLAASAITKSQIRRSRDVSLVQPFGDIERAMDWLTE
jgi:hypothetical protein